MLWSDRFRVALALFGVVGLSGCFTPLYSEAAHPGINEAMKEVEVPQIDGRLGHYLVDDLITDMNGTGATPKAKYRLAIKTSQSSNTPTVASQLGLATSVTLIENADITLTKIEGGEVIFHGTAQSAAPYDSSLDSYANLRAARDAELRLARSLALEIETRVGAALAAKFSPAG